MTSDELIQAFRIGMDKVDTLANPSFEVDEILFFLNKAKGRYEENLYLGRNSTGESFDETERNRKALATLTKPWSCDDDDFTAYNFLPYPYKGWSVNLPSDVKWVLREYGVIQFADATKCVTATDLEVYIETKQLTWLAERSKMLPIFPTRMDELAYKLDDPFQKPTTQELLRLDDDSEHVIVLVDSDDYDLEAYFNQYLRDSAEITAIATYELPVWTHQKIVDIAVSIALETIESPRMQTTNLDQIKND